MGCTRFVLVYRVAGGSVWVYRWVTHCVGVHGVGVAVGDVWVTWWVYRWETCGWVYRWVTWRVWVYRWVTWRVWVYRWVTRCVWVYRWVKCCVGVQVGDTLCGCIGG